MRKAACAEGGITHCNQSDGECENEDLKSCATCIAPMWCMCERPEVVEMVRSLWGHANQSEAPTMD